MPNISVGQGNKNITIVAAASGGGHWVELMRLKPFLEKYPVHYISTNPGFAATIDGQPFHLIPEVTRWNKWKVLPVMWKLLSLLRRIKPSVVISTGAGPGLLALFAGKITGAKTIWIESLCHAEHISLSGKMALRFCDRVYTQWPHLATGKVIYSGKVI